MVAAPVLAAVIGVAGAILAFVFPAAADHRTLWITGATAFLVQLLTFAMTRLAGQQNVMAAWGVGAIVRLLTIAVFALALVKPLGLVLTPALVGLATFFFLSTLAEPLLLKL